MSNQVANTICSRLSALIAIILFCVAPVAHAAPNAPSDVVVLPRYDATITLIVTWTDNSGDETGFEIGRRAVGDAEYVSQGTVGVGVTTYEDVTATPDKMWEYQVRALGGAAEDSGWIDSENATSPEIEWPVDDGTSNILHGYGHPLETGAANLYYHDGVDFANTGQINAARGGRIAGVSLNDNGSVDLEVDAGAAGTCKDSYGHLYGDDIPFVAGANDPVAPGEMLATSLYDFGRDADANHCHVEVLPAGGGETSALSIFPDNAGKDPHGNAPVVADVNDDGDDFIVVSAAANDHTAPREPAWGDVDLLVDAYDDMSTANDLVVNPQSVGYWIQPTVPGGSSVQNAATPYCLISFFDPAVNLCGSPCGGEAIAEDALYDDLPADMHGINTWQSFLTWVVTNTDGTDGDHANIDPAQFWRTDARVGSGTEPNGSDADRARENQEAAFRDGTYYAHIILKDLVHTTDAVRSVVVDNSRPYVERLTVYSGERIVYQARWVWDGAAAQLELQPATFDAAAQFTALRTQDVTVEVEFSEPMAIAVVTAVTAGGGASALGVTPTLASTDPAHARTIWRGLISNLDIADDGSHDGTHMLTISGTDLAGNALLQINGRAAMGANHHNRDAAGNMRGAIGTDTIHGFRIGPLSGVIPVTAIFMKQGAADPPAPTTADRALAIQTALNAYFDEVSYSEISFAVTPQGWYQLQHALDWYETDPRTPLIDLVQEAVTAAETDGVALDEYVLVVTDEDVVRAEWSTNGAWPYTVVAAPGWRLLASGTLNAATTDAGLTNLVSRMVGLIDLFAYPEVIVARPFVGPWSHMSDKEHNVHVLGWEKWRMGWLDETGTTTGNTVTRVAKPTVASPIVDQTYTIRPTDTDDNNTKMVAIDIGDRLHYTAEYRRQQNLDTDLPDAGVVITKTNDYVNQGEGPAIIQESAVTSADLSDAPFTVTAPRNVFDDVGSGVNIEVTAMNANEAEIRLNYAVPPTENDVYVTQQDNHWKTIDIWVDAPDLAGDFAADPLTVINANEKPVVGELNKVYGRVRNQGHADATNFEVYLEIREPWAAGGPFRELNVETVPLLQGQDTNAVAYHVIVGDWTPSGDVHSCVKLTVLGVANDVNPENNWTQENISQFVTTQGSPYAPITTRFEVENPFDEIITVFFKLDGLPGSWSYIMSPERLILEPKAVGSAQVTVQPGDGAPVCSSEVITVTAYTPRVDTLKQLGAITLQVGLKNEVTIDARTTIDCGQADRKSSEQLMHASTFARRCNLITEGCTSPPVANAQIAVVYTAPDGTKQVRYVTTDADGCFSDVVTVPDPARWETQVVLEETDCLAEARTPPLHGGPVGGTSITCRMLWALMIIALIAAIVWFARWRCMIPSARVPFLIALAIAIAAGWLLLNSCDTNLCWFWLSVALAVIIALLIIIFSPFVPCIGRSRGN